jgi:eukaryotic-like serine/threonine-protein kinase
VTTSQVGEEALFNAARQIADEVARAEYLREAAGGDEALVQRVGALLAVYDIPDRLLDQPAAAAVLMEALNSMRRAEPSAVTSAESAGSQIGPYKLLQPIGEGGMGTVYMAEQTQPVRRTVALKLIKVGMDSRQVLARFGAERQALALMDHPNIAKVLDAGATEHGRPYFVMELIKGIPITKFCDERRLTLRERLELAIPVCQAVQHAHQKGIIHRDLKPSNVLIALYDGKPVPKIIDFGVAKATGPRLTDQTLYTEFGAVVGTLEYMSPEQAELNQLDIDTRSDIYSLGVLLYELLTGSTPLEHKRLKAVLFLEVLRLIREEESPRPSMRLSTTEELASIAACRHVEPRKLSGLVRGELDWIVMKALEKDRNRRYVTANGLAADLRRYLDDEQVQACPPSVDYRLRKFARRNKATLAVICVIAAALVMAVVGLAVSNWLVARERNQKTQALFDKEKALASESMALAKAKEKEGLAIERAGEARRQQTIAEGQELLARRRFYAAQMNLAYRSWETGNIARVLDLLESQRPRLDEDDLRTFEWYYLWRRCYHGRRLTLRGHAGNVGSIAFSPDGKILVSGSNDGTAKVWDLATGRVCRTLPINSHVTSVAFSPDGKTLASGSWDKPFLRLWDVSTGQLLRTFEGQQGYVWSVAFSPGGKTLVSGSQDQTVMLWDVATGLARATLRGQGVPVTSVAVSPDDKTIASSSGWTARAVKIWDVATGKERFTFAGGDPVAFSPDGTLATGNEVKLWDVMMGRERPTTTGSWAAARSFSPDGKMLAQGGHDKNVTLWELATGLMRIHHGRRGRISCIAFSPDGKTLASAAAGNDAAIELWDVPPANKPATPVAHTGGAFGFGDVYSQPPYILWAGEPATLAHTGGPVSVAFSPDSKALASAGGSGTKLWDLASGKLLAAFTSAPSIRPVLAFSPDGQNLAVEQGNAVKLMDVATRQELRTLTGHRNVVTGIAFGPDKRTLGSVSHDGTLKLWDLSTLQAPTTIRVPSTRMCLAFSPDGRTVATGGQYFRVDLWDPATGAHKGALEMQEGEHSEWAFSVSFSPDGKTLAVGGHQGMLKLWSMETRMLQAALRGHTELIQSLAFSPDGRTLASGCCGGTVKLWDVITGQERVTFKCCPGWGSMAFSPDGASLAMAGGDGEVKLLRAATDAEAKARKTDTATDYAGERGHNYAKHGQPDKAAADRRRADEMLKRPKD